MDFLGVVINYILNLGAPVFVPFIMLLAGLVVRMKFRDAASAAITLGVAFVGMSMLIGFMVDAIGVAAQTMMNRTGLELSIVDGGWTTMANISWAWPYAFAMFPLQVGVNIVMLMLNKTNTFNADLWNVWGKIFTAFIVVSVTTPLFGPVWSLVLAFLVAAFQIIMELNAGIFTSIVLRNSRDPGVTCTHRMVFFGPFITRSICCCVKFRSAISRWTPVHCAPKSGSLPKTISLVLFWDPVRSDRGLQRRENADAGCAGLDGVGAVPDDFQALYAGAIAHL